MLTSSKWNVESPTPLVTLRCCLWPSAGAHQNHAHRCNVHVCIGRARHVKHTDQPLFGIELGITQRLLQEDIPSTKALSTYNHR